MPLFSDDPDALELFTPSAGIVQDGAATFVGTGFFQVTADAVAAGVVTVVGSGFLRFVGTMTGPCTILPRIEERAILPRIDSRTILPKVS